MGLHLIIEKHFHLFKKLFNKVVVVILLSIHKIPKSRNFHVSPPQVLKPGQIILGKIEKLFKNNHAQIKLGNRVMIAQIESPLKVGEHYYFQVKSLSNRIHLKVIHQTLHPNIHGLMNYLNINDHQTNVNFVQFLIKHKIPFEQKQVSQAVKILNQINNKEIAQNILRYMISENLPITNSIFQGLYAIHTKQLSDQLHSFLHQLNQRANPSYIEQLLMNRIQSMVGTSNIKQFFVSQIIYEVMENKHQMYHLLKATGLIDQINYSHWKSEWKMQIHHHSGSNERLPLNLNVETSLEAILHMNNNHHDIKQLARKLLSQWDDMISKTTTHQNILPNQKFTRFKQELNHYLSPLLPNTNIQDVFENLQNNHSELGNMLTILQTLANEQTYRYVEDLLLYVNMQETSVKNLFLNQFQKMLFHTGLADENIMANATFNQSFPSIKSMLIQYIQQNNASNNEQAQQLLHIMNGLQLQSIHETNSFIYASLQIPGEKLHLNNDLQLEFESKKTEDGKINPDYCRILFYLELTNLDETIIDMHIQNRYISITVYNDQEKLKEKCILFQPLLKKSLKNYNYELTSVTVKPLQEKSVTDQMKPMQNNKISFEGIDYRI